MHCEGLRGLWNTCPTTVTLEHYTPSQVADATNSLILLALVVMAVLTIMFAGWISGQLD